MVRSTSLQPGLTYAVVGLGWSSWRAVGPSTSGHSPIMLTDILIAIAIVIVAAVLGLVVHPLLWFIVVLAAVWLFTRRGSRSRV